MTFPKMSMTRTITYLAKRLSQILSLSGALSNNATSMPMLAEIPATTTYYDMNEKPPLPTPVIHPDVESAERARNEFALQYGYYVVKLRSISRQGKQCDCSGIQICYTDANESLCCLKVPSRFNCPFCVMLLERQNGDWKYDWTFSIHNPRHNHPPSVEPNPLIPQRSYLQKHCKVVIKMLHECLPITEILKQLGELDPSVTLHKIGYLNPTNGLGAS